MTTDKKTPLIILTAGGTGGHVYPADALAQELSKRRYKLVLVTDKRGLHNYRGKLGEIKNYQVWSGALVGKSKWFKIKSLCKTIFGILQSMVIIIRNHPRCVVGFGGYASFPCSVAALLLGVPLIIHEQNSVMSRTNRFLAKYASAVATSFPNTKYAPRNERCIHSGMPVRPEIRALFERSYTMPADDEKFNLLVLGGSQGAKIFSEVIPQAIKLLTPEQQKKIHIIQQCRQEDIAELQQAYTSTACSTTISHFFENMPELYAKCHLIISRAGASSVSEIATAGIPSILVPLPTAADDHQTLNAAELKNRKGGIVISQSAFNADKLFEVLNNFLVTPQKLKDFAANTKKFAKINANKRLANIVECLSKRG